MKDIGKKIRELRESKNMSQEELAHKVGYKSRASINKIELQRDVPINKIVPIAKALDVTPSFIMGWEEELKSTQSYQQGVEMGELLKKYNQLTDESKLVVLNLIDSLLAMQNK